MARPGKSADASRPPPRLRRAYYDCRYGQLHIHNAIPAGGGFDELTPVIALHAAGETGRVFVPLLPALGQARSVYALDLPGAGESDPAPGVTAADAAVHAVIDFIDSMRLRRVDLLARGDAAAAAQKLLAQRAAALRQVVLLAPEPAVKPGSSLAVLGAAEVADPELPARLVALLAGPT